MERNLKITFYMKHPVCVVHRLIKTKTLTLLVSERTYVRRSVVYYTHYSDEDFHSCMYTKFGTAYATYK